MRWKGGAVLHGVVPHVHVALPDHAAAGLGLDHIQIRMPARGVELHERPASDARLDDAVAIPARQASYVGEGRPNSVG
jgi:hypothetical protein